VRWTVEKTASRYRFFSNLLDVDPVAVDARGNATGFVAAGVLHVTPR
jgi:hypothetical protein